MSPPRQTSIPKGLPKSNLTNAPILPKLILNPRPSCVRYISRISPLLLVNLPSTPTGSIPTLPKHSHSRLCPDARRLDTEVDEAECRRTIAVAMRAWRKHPILQLCIDSSL